MKLKFNKFHKSKNSAWGQHALFWEIELVDYDFTELIELLKSNTSLWDNHNPQGIGRSSVNLLDTRLTEFRHSVNQLKHDILNSIYIDAESELKGVLFKGKQFYQDSAVMQTQIYKDSPGFSMTPHLDNNHILFQLIINITDNETGTRIFEPSVSDIDCDTKKPYYTMTGEKNKGILFFNNFMLPHDIQHITKDRYILYSSIVI